MPELRIVAGANGSGKSSLTKLSSVDISVIDPDAIAREIAPNNPESAALAAGRKAILVPRGFANERAREYIQSDCSFIVETTLAGNTYLNLMREVKALGWFVSLTYIGINNPITNIQRVQTRVTLGGHDVPRSDILRRYERSLNNLIKAATIVDKLTLYDNSTSAGHQLVEIRDRAQTVIYMQELPGWIDRSNLNL